MVIDDMRINNVLLFLHKRWLLIVVAAAIAAAISAGGRGSGSSCSTFELILFFLHTSTNDWTYCCSLSIIFTLFVPFHLDIPRIVRASLIGIPISGKSLAYMCGLQVWTRVLYYSGKVKMHYAFQLIQIHFLSKWFQIYLHRIDFP